MYKNILTLTLFNETADFNLKWKGWKLSGSE